MKKPDCCFTVTVCEKWRLTSCAVKNEQESRGLFGFHPWESCSDCVLTFEGWEFWGENGHMQGWADTREMLVFWIRRQAVKQWRMRDGRIMGYKFRRGGRMTYRAK